MDRWVTDLAGALTWARDLEEVGTVFRRFAHAAGVASHAYAFVGADGRHRHLDTNYHRDWVGHYLAHDYQAIDPVVLEARTAKLPFAWRFLLNRETLSAAQTRLFDEAADFGIRDGLTMPFASDHGQWAVLSFAFESSARMAQVMAAQPNLRLLGIYCHAAVERLLDAAQPATASPLSIQERDCLTGMAAGRSLWDISAALHLPEQQVAFLLRTAREKMGCATTAQAVFRAMADGWITP